jgi:hypothetical protein
VQLSSLPSTQTDKRICGIIRECFVEGRIDIALWFKILKKEIPIWSSVMVTRQQYGHHIWTNVRIIKSTFHDPSCNWLSWKSFSFHRGNKTYLRSTQRQERLSLLSLLPLGKAFVTQLKKSPPPLLGRGYWNICINSIDKRNFISNDHVIISRKGFIFDFSPLTCCVTTFTFSFIISIIIIIFITGARWCKQN